MDVKQHSTNKQSVGVQELYESQGGGPGHPSLINLRFCGRNATLQPGRRTLHLCQPLWTGVASSGTDLGRQSAKCPSSPSSTRRPPSEFSEVVKVGVVVGLAKGSEWRENKLRVERE